MSDFDGSGLKRPILSVSSVLLICPCLEIGSGIQAVRVALLRL